jgi:pterin-4a-carbinolamine dehydratase
MQDLAKIMTNELPLWHSKEGSAMTRSFTAHNLQSALDALNAFGAIAEREGHHPDMVSGDMHMHIGMMAFEWLWISLPNTTFLFLLRI